MDCLIATVEHPGVNKDTRYVFPAPTRGSMKYLHGNYYLAAVVDRLPLQQPSAIKSTKLQKYIVTVLQIVDLNSSELDWLARHLGHDIAVHSEYYKLHDHTIELSKVSRLLLVVDEGNASKWADKKLDEIGVHGMCAMKNF